MRVVVVGGGSSGEHFVGALRRLDASRTSASTTPGSPHTTSPGARPVVDLGATQQLTLAIRAETPIEVLLDVIQPHPTFSEAVFLALRELDQDMESRVPPVG